MKHETNPPFQRVGLKKHGLVCWKESCVYFFCEIPERETFCYWNMHKLNDVFEKKKEYVSERLIVTSKRSYWCIERRLYLWCSNRTKLFYYEIRYKNKFSFALLLLWNYTDLVKTCSLFEENKITVIIC